MLLNEFNRGRAMGKAKILLVEDKKPIADFMRLLLAQEGYCVSGVIATGEEAIDVALETHPDLILMNIKLKGKIDGIKACEQIRLTTDIPVVFVSAFTDEETMAEAMQHKPSGYLTKPFRTKWLIREIEMALAGH